MKELVLPQFNHLWRNLELVVQDFTSESWLKTGYQLPTPGLEALWAV